MEEIAPGQTRTDEQGQRRARADGQQPRRALVFVGFMGAGKSTAAADAARALGLKTVDSDAEIERREGVSVAQLFAQHGEARFREIEEQVALELLTGASAQEAISLGGGSVLSGRVQQALADHLVVLLDVDAETAWERVQGEGAGLAGAEGARRVGENERPLARDEERFIALHAARQPIYAALADATLPARVRGIAGRAKAGLQMLRAAPPGAKLLWANTASGEYPVLVRRGLVSEGLIGAGAAAAWPLDRERSRPFCVTDANVAPLYGEKLGELAASIAIPSGESQKTVATAETVWRGMLDAGMTRADHVVALGGGVVGDLAGFCAATYQRGVPHVQVPSTLVAQVDSAYGGKTGVDLPEGKNYVGAYHQPSGVIVDPDMLATLPPRELSAGWVEVAKTALIAGGELWERVSTNHPLDERTILLCAQTKIEVVAEDERDAGARQALNLGHTIGHAIETATGYRRYLHGEAVGLGLLAALRLSGAGELRSHVSELMRVRGLPLSLRGASVEEVLDAVHRDKKRLGAEVPFVLVQAPGAVRVGQRVGEAELRAAVAELCAAASSG
jgi:shikimate kinase / 3-dehydroquinate synthase